MIQTLLPLERFRSQLRVIEASAWIIWSGIFLFSLFGGVQPDRRFPVLILLGAGAVYLVLLFHHLLERFFPFRWFHFLHFSIIGLLVFIAVRLVDALAPVGGLVMVLAVILSAMSGGWALSLYVAVLSAVIAGVDPLDSTNLAQLGFGFLVRLIIYLTLVIIVCRTMEQVNRSRSDSTSFNERYVQQTERQLRELRTLHELATAIGSAFDLHEMLQQAMTKTLAVLGMESAFIALLGDDGQELAVVAQSGLPEEVASQLREFPLRAGQGLPGLAVAEGRPLFSADIARDPRTHYSHLAEAGYKGYVCIPLKVQSAVAGVLGLMGYAERIPDTNELAFLGAIGEQIGLALQRVRSYAAEQRRSGQLATLSQMGREITALLHRDELVRRTVALIRANFGYYAVHVFLAESENGLAHMVSGSVADSETPVSSPSLLIGREGLVGRAIGENRVILENDVKRNPGYVEGPGLERARSELVVPIVLGERVLGALDAQDDHIGAFKADDVFILQTIAAQLAVAIVNAELHMAAEQQARTDSLTQVYNHGYLLQRLSVEVDSARASGQPLSLIMLDIDHFKQYNDRYGHLLGDQVLVLTAQVIRQHIKHGDIVGRWGGEEFGIALPRTSLAQAMIVAQRIRRTLAAMALHDEQGNPIDKPTVSQGIASFPQHAATPEALVDCADRRLYEAKNNGRDQVATGDLQRDSQNQILYELSLAKENPNEQT